MGKLFKVVDVFQLKDRLVLMTDVVDQPDEHKHGDIVELRRPDGKTIRTESWYESHSFAAPPANIPPLCIGIAATLTKADVPIGTEVWSVADAVKKGA
jgi:hypothetical protein